MLHRLEKMTKNMAYKYASLNQKHRKSLVTLLDAVFSIQNSDKEALVTWKYYHPFFKNSIFQYGAITDDGEEQIVSHYANIPLEIVHKDKIYKGAACVDMATHPLHRGKGLISTLSKLVYTDIARENIDVSIGFSNEAGVLVDKHSKNYGYHIIGKFQSYYSILTKRKSTICELQRVASFEEEMPLKNEYFSVHKTVEYLTWRYKDNPNNGYMFYKVLINGRFYGYVVLKNSNIRTHVIDIISDNSSVDTMKNIITAINNIALEHKKRFTTLCVLDNKFWHGVFNKTLSFKKNSKKNTFYLTVKLHNPRIGDNTSILDKDSWLCFVGDIL